MSDAPPLSPMLEARIIENIRVLREHRNWSQSELARRMADAGWPKYTQMTVSRTEKGERPIRVDEAATLARVFGIDTADLWLDEDHRNWQEGLHQYKDADRLLMKAQEDYSNAVFRLAAVADGLDESGQLDEETGQQVENALSLTPRELFWISCIQRRNARETGPALDALGGRFSERWREEYIATAEEAAEFHEEYPDA